jgi:hypothetical protein
MPQALFLLLLRVPFIILPPDFITGLQTVVSGIVVPRALVVHIEVRVALLCFVSR